MELIRSNNAETILKEIESNFRCEPISSTNKEHRGIDRYFWLRAEKRNSGKRGHSIYSFLDCKNPRQQSGYRICNLVLQGGGTLGLAHVGFITGLEHAGIRFAGLAGTSAGSVVAMGVAAIRGNDLTRKTHSELTEIIENMPLNHFIDGPRPVRKMIKNLLKGQRVYAPQNWVGYISAIQQLRRRRGLNRGDNFEVWLESVFAEIGFTDIDRLYQTLDQIWHDLGDLRDENFPGRNGEVILNTPEQPNGNGSATDHPGRHLLQLFAMSMPVGLKFNLPHDLYLLSPHYKAISPARLVRTSMSIPGFFEPIQMQTNNQTWPEYIKKNMQGLLPANRIRHFADLENLFFLDGGLMSNLPSDSFRDLMPTVPTIVVPLISDSDEKKTRRRRKMPALVEDAGACASAVRLQRDREIWFQNDALRSKFDQEQSAIAKKKNGYTKRIYPVAIAAIDTGDENWLNFSMLDDNKAALFEAGLRAALNFLAQIDKGGQSDTQRIS